MNLFNTKTRFIILCIIILFSSYQKTFAQGVPKGFNYQTAVRDKSGNLLANKAVKIRIKFTDNAGAVVYWQEDFSPTTTAIGLANLVLGNGTKSAGTKSAFSDIPWTGAAPKMEILLDADGSGNYVSMGTSNFWSVPYAMTADSLSKTPKLSYLLDVSKTAATTGQVLKWDGLQWVPSAEATAGTANGDVTGSLSALTVIKLQGKPVGTTSPTTGQLLKWDGAAWNPASETSIPTPGGDVSGSLTSMTVIKLQGNAVATTSPTTGQVLKWDGSKWAPAAESTGGTPGGDVSGSIGSLTVVKLQGNAVASTAPTSGQVLKWNGTAWAPAAESGGGGTPGGDVSGTISSMNVIKLQGNAVSSNLPTTGQIMKWNGTAWTPTDTSKLFTPWLPSGSDIYFSAGNVGINTSSPKNRLHIIEKLGSKTEGVRVETTAGGTVAIFSGVYSEIKATSGAGLAFYGRSTGKNSAGYNAGLSGYSSGSVQNIGTLGYGSGATTSSANYGVYGHGDSSSVANYGTYGEATWVTTTGSTVNEGLFGYAKGSSYINTAVFGNSDATGSQNSGVFGTTSGAGTLNIGTFGRANGATNNYGIYGSTSSTASGSFAGYFSGNVQIVGSIAKSSGSFKIDHPLDPANKYLYHSFVESPDMMNVYNGNVSTGADGEVTVTLPDYFQALNKDYRYQLTVIGDFAQAIVYKEVADNKFVIKTSKPNVKVSWQVTGIRHDPYAEKYPIVPVVEKTGREKGKYLIPELYGQPHDLQVYPEPVVPQQTKPLPVR